MSLKINLCYCNSSVKEIKMSNNNSYIECGEICNECKCVYQVQYFENDDNFEKCSVCQKTIILTNNTNDKCFEMRLRPSDNEKNLYICKNCNKS